MNSITRFEIKKLHGNKDVDLKLHDNTLILVGENGVGKTTVLRFLFCTLSGQWLAVAKYKFESVAVTIDGEKYTLPYAAIMGSLPNIDQRVLSRFPPPFQSRVLALLENVNGGSITQELEYLCTRFGVPLSFLLPAINKSDTRSSDEESQSFNRNSAAIVASLGAQLLYMPTYRRIELDLSDIYPGVDKQEIRHRDWQIQGQREKAFVELVEFGMKDVETAVDRTQTTLDQFARKSLNDLTFGYLGDIVKQLYSKVVLREISVVPEETIENILGRIQDHILSSANKDELRHIIKDVKSGLKDDEHAKVICHYFMKLMKFHEDFEARESNIVDFCGVCNNYMPTKEFKYDTSSFQFTIRPKASCGLAPEIKLNDLSSGEKQIVSLFSHLYLSGGKKYFVLIDEPELSLSVPWQTTFLPDIRNADFCTGLVAVTHSPFIYDNELRQYAHGLGEFIQEAQQ